MKTFPIKKKFSKSSLSSALQSSTIQTSGMRGPTNSRARARIREFKITGKVVISLCDYETFYYFYYKELGNGCLPFLWQHPLDCKPVICYFDHKETSFKITSVDASRTLFNLQMTLVMRYKEY